MKFYLFFLVLLALIDPLSGQNRHSIEVGGDYGELILHSKDIRPIGPSSPYGIGVQFSYWLLKENSWKYCHCYPRVGVSLNYHNYDNPPVLGYGIPLYGFLEPWYKLTPRLYFTLRGAAGYGWLSKPYNEVTNPLNQSYSLHFTPYIMVGTGLGFKLTDQWRTSLQIRYNHSSNGGLREPNKGLNYPTAHLSLSYSWKDISFTEKEKIPLSQLTMKRYLNVSAFIASKSIDASHTTYAVPGVEVSYTHQFTRTSAFSGGVEWINNLAYRERIERQNLNVDHNEVSILGGHRFLLGNFTFSQMIGVYLYDPYDTTPDWYQRYSLTWFPWEQLGIGTALKAHGHVAEFLDVRLTYRLPFSKK